MASRNYPAGASIGNHRNSKALDEIQCCHRGGIGPNVGAQDEKWFGGDTDRVGNSLEFGRM
ncbi:hypothetical protein GALL_554920 [mine drainage metagenome]|uniref:Uncharacterized protein n=1 Tax=mine drainage metagenome TaxID=410659 RepID=A0A1J5PHD8_9ZZZZ